MEKIIEKIENSFDLKKNDLRDYSPLALAYIGDCIYELVIRTMLIENSNTNVNKLHKKSSEFVKAKTQAKIIELLIDDLTEKEISIYKRGRNAHSPTMAKHATVGEYRKATGFEALMGYLYLEGNEERMFSLIKLGLKKIGENNE